VPADRGVSSVVGAILILAILVIAGDVLFNGALTDGQRNKDINANRALLELTVTVVRLVTRCSATKGRVTVMTSSN